MNYKIILLTAIMSIIVLFGGCSSAITVGLHTLPDGSIRQMYTISLDRTEMSRHYTDEEINTIFEVSKNYVSNYIARVEALADQCATDNGYQGNHCISNTESNAENLTITGIIMYSSATFYNLFNATLAGQTPPSEEEGQENESAITVEEGLFYDKNILMTGTNPIADEDSILTVYNAIEQALSNQGIEFTFDINQLNLAYDYAVLYTDAQVARIRSDADQEYIQTETNLATGATYQMKHFVWYYDADGDNTITLFSYSIHSVAWYVTALIIVVIFGVVLYIVYLIKKSKKNKNATMVETNTIETKDYVDIESKGQQEV